MEQDKNNNRILELYNQILDLKDLNKSLSSKVKILWNFFIFEMVLGLILLVIKGWYFLEAISKNH